MITASERNDFSPMSKLQHDFTQGPIGRELVSFCIPFLLSNVLQALYGAVDMWVVGNFSAADADTLLLVFDEEVGLFPTHRVIPIGGEDDIAAQVKRLFAALREADAAGAKKILAPLPAETGLSLALYNRMIRAAAHNIITL